MGTLEGMESRRVRRTKKMLKIAFIELLEYKPFEKISVKDIVEYADFNRCTFYNYYNYKEELVKEIMDETLLEISQTISFSSKSSPHLKLKDITIFDYILKKKRLFKLWKDAEAIPGFNQQFVDTLIFTIKKDRHPIFSGNSECHNEILIIMWVHGTFGLIINWIKEDFATDPKILAKHYLKLLHDLFENSGKQGA
jgi:hypothetical protein